MAAGLATWSGLTLLASGARNFGELLTARIGFAAAQAVQNPISFALSECTGCFGPVLTDIASDKMYEIQLYFVPHAKHHQAGIQARVSEGCPP